LCFSFPVSLSPGFIVFFHEYSIIADVISARAISDGCQPGSFGRDLLDINCNAYNHKCKKDIDCARIEHSEITIDQSDELSIVPQTDPSVILRGNTPRLIDERQEKPALWNHIVQGTPDQIFGKPKLPATQDFLSRLRLP